MLRYGLIVVLAMVLASCGSSPSKPKRPKTDHGPSRPVDVSHIPDATPKWERRTRAGNKSPYTILGKTYYLMPDSKDFRQKGLASWYGYKFHGRKTSNGETYDMYAMTAAHKTLPIPSYVRVTNQNNGRSVIVRVNDRGPFHEGRVIDLSYTAAKKLGFVNQGTAPVAVEAIDTGNPAIAVVARPASAKLSSLKQPGKKTVGGQRYLQLAAFNQRQSAENLQTQLQQLLPQPVRIHFSAAKSLHRVRVGPIAGDQQQLEDIYRRIASLRLGTGFLVKE